MSAYHLFLHYIHLSHYRYSAKCIHGDKRQEEREHVLQEFREGYVTILVATDVAARGLGNKKDTAAAAAPA